MLQIILSIVVFAIFIRWVYYEFILPAHLSQFHWYARYEHIRMKLKEADGFITHLETRRLVKEFTNDLTIKDCVEYRQCIHRLGKLLSRNQKKFLPKLAD